MCLSSAEYRQIAQLLHQVPRRECVATSGGKVPCINNLGAKRRRDYNITLRPLYTVKIRRYIQSVWWF